MKILNMKSITGYYSQVSALDDRLRGFYIRNYVYKDSWRDSLCSRFVINITEAHEPSAFEVEMVIE